MRFLRQRTAEDTEAANPDNAEVDAPSEPVLNGARTTTPAKGRPTPKRRDAEARRRGPVPPPPRTQREAFKRSKTTKEDRHKEAAQRRERMAAGDDRYLMPRDRGPVKAYVRDLVDCKRHLAGLFMPLALCVLLVMVAPSPMLQFYAPPVAMAALVVMILDGILIGRNAVQRVRLKFPDATDSGLSLGWYAFVRSSQIRRLRMPKPQVKLGDSV